MISYSDSEASPVLIRDEDLADLSQVITGALQQGGLDAGTATVLGFLYGQSRQATADDLMVFTMKKPLLLCKALAYPLPRQVNWQ